MDRIFNMVTIPQRIKSLEDTVKSILPQCDLLNIYMNNFGDKPLPPFLIHPKIVLYKSEQEAGDIGDVGKFYCCEDWENGYIFTIDDKYIYPPDYALRLIETIEKYNRQAVISCHGRTIKQNCKSYYKDPGQQFSLEGAIKEDTFIHICGTGCMAFYSGTFRFKLDMFSFSNMSDILVGIALQKAKVPVLVMAHKYKWISLSSKCSNNYSIHSFCSNNDSIQTNTVNRHKWKIYTCSNFNVL